MNTIKINGLSKVFTQQIRGEGILNFVKSVMLPVNREIRAVDEISMNIEEGELVGFIGPNGAGKSTTLKMMSGILYPTTGDITVLGYKPFERKYEFLKQIGMVMGQKSQLNGDLPPKILLEMNRDIYKVDNIKYKEVVTDLVDMFNVKELMNVQVRKMSLGERMKFELISSLLHSPKIIFLDEPTIGLDVNAQKSMREFVKDYNEKYNATVILTSHNMDDVKKLCKRLIIINHGCIVFDGSIDSLYKRFSEEKYISVQFEKRIDIKQLAKYGELKSSDEYGGVIAVSKKEHSKIVANILNEFEVDNIDITEPTLEEIISNLYNLKKNEFQS